MNAADTDARREGAGMGSLRAVSGGVESGMFQDEGAPDATGTSRTGRPQLPPHNSFGWVRAEPNALAVAPIGPSAPTPESDTPKEIPSRRGAHDVCGKVQTSVLPGAPHPPIGTLEASGHRGNSTPAHALVAGAGNGE